MNLNSLLIYFLLLFSFPSFAQISAQPDRKENVETEEEENDGEPNYLKRLRYYRESRGLDAPDAPLNYNAYLFNEFKEQERRRSNERSRVNTGDWISDGPDNFVSYTSIGRVHRLAFHPTDTSRIYAATAGGGLWYTFNHGASWQPLSDNIPINNLSGVVVDQNDPNTLYILTGDGPGLAGTSAYSQYQLSKPSVGVFKSTDHGLTWNTTDLNFLQQDAVTAWNLIAHPTNSNILYAVTSQGIYRTENGGNTWPLQYPSAAYDLRFNPDDPEIVYAVGRTGFFRSIDGGDSWDVEATIPLYYGNDGRMALSVCPDDPDRIYIYAGPQEDTLSSHRGVFRSNNGGDSFTQLDTVSNITTGDVTEYAITCLCNPNDSDEVLIGEVNVAKSTNQGGSFSPSPGLHADQHQLIVNPLFPNRVYMANDGGIYYSDDFGDANSWNYISEYLRITQYYKIAVGQENDQLVIGGAQDNGTHRKQSTATQFTYIHHSDGMDCAIHPTNDSLLIASAQNGNFVFSSDQGDTYDSSFGNSNLPDTVNTAWVTPVAWNPNDTSNIFLGYEPIYRSFDGGITFNQIPDTVGGNIQLHIGTGNRLYASDRYNGGEHHLHVSLNLGNTWTPIHTNMDASLLTRRKSGITTNPNDDTEVWVAIAGWANNMKVFRSINAGDSWTNETGSLPNIPVNCIIYGDPDFTPAGSVYVGTDLGVYYRNDALGDWIQFDNGLPAVEVSDLELQYDSQTIYAGTFGRGIWPSEFYTDCPDHLVLNPSNLSPKEDYFFQANNTIELSNYTIESVGANMKLKAGDLILLQGGVIGKTENGNLFKARLSPCGGGVEE